MHGPPRGRRACGGGREGAGRTTYSGWGPKANDQGLSPPVQMAQRGEDKESNQHGKQPKDGHTFPQDGCSLLEFQSQAKVELRSVGTVGVQTGRPRRVSTASQAVDKPPSVGSVGVQTGKPRRVSVASQTVAYQEFGEHLQGPGRAAQDGVCRTEPDKAVDKPPITCIEKVFQSR